MGCYVDYEEDIRKESKEHINILQQNKQKEQDNNGDLWILYKYILIESDLKKIRNNIKIFLISAESIPQLLKIIEESKILEYKNNSIESMMKIYEKQLIDLFRGYKLETNMKIYNDFVECKDIAGDSNEKANEFIIVDEKFLEIAELERENEKKYLIIEDINDRQKIYFPKADLSLDFKYKRKGIFCFTNVDYENNDKISFDSVNNNSIILKRKLKKNSSQNSNILNNDNKNSLEKEPNYAKDNYDDKDKKDEQIIKINNNIMTNQIINSYKEENNLEHNNKNKKHLFMESKQDNNSKINLKNIDNNSEENNNNLNFYNKNNENMLNNHINEINDSNNNINNEIKIINMNNNTNNEPLLNNMNNQNNINNNVNISLQNMDNQNNINNIGSLDNYNQENNECINLNNNVNNNIINNNNMYNELIKENMNKKISFSNERTNESINMNNIMNNNINNIIFNNNVNNSNNNFNINNDNNINDNFNNNAFINNINNINIFSNSNFNNNQPNQPNPIPAQMNNMQNLNMNNQQMMVNNKMNNMNNQNMNNAKLMVNNQMNNMQNPYMNNQQMMVNNQMNNMQNNNMINPQMMGNNQMNNMNIQNMINPQMMGNNQMNNMQNNNNFNPMINNMNNNQQFMNNMNNQPNIQNNALNNINIINNNNFNINNNMNIINNMQRREQDINNNEIINKNNSGNNLNIAIKKKDTNMKNAYLREIKKFHEPPLIGLANIGATCYMNATLQCLSNINLLTGFFLYKKNFFQKIPIGFSDKQISKAYSDVVYHLWNPDEPKKYYSPDYFKQVISSKNKLFEGVQANDSKDLLIFLFENIHKELNTMAEKQSVENDPTDQKNAEYELTLFRTKYFQENKSIITDLFYFDQANITTCLNCGTKIYNFAMHNILIFPLEKTRLFKEQKERDFANVKIKDCLDCHVNPEQNQPGNTFYCNSCHKEANYLLENKISSYPEILTVVLNRGKHLEYDIGFEITFLLDNMDDYMIKLNSNKQDIGTRYKLIGVINHSGNSGMDGHFFTYCMSPINRKWYQYNDAMVSEIIDPNQEIRGIPYLLFYQRIRK